MDKTDKFLMYAHVHKNILKNRKDILMGISFHFHNCLLDYSWCHWTTFTHYSSCMPIALNKCLDWPEFFKLDGVAQIIIPEQSMSFVAQPGLNCHFPFTFAQGMVTPPKNFLYSRHNLLHFHCRIIMLLPLGRQSWSLQPTS